CQCACHDPSSLRRSSGPVFVEDNLSVDPDDSRRRPSPELGGSEQMQINGASMEGREGGDDQAARIQLVGIDDGAGSSINNDLIKANCDASTSLTNNSQHGEDARLCTPTAISNQDGQMVAFSTGYGSMGPQCHEEEKGLSLPSGLGNDGPGSDLTLIVGPESIGMLSSACEQVFDKSGINLEVLLDVNCPENLHGRKWGRISVRENHGTEILSSSRDGCGRCGLIGVQWGVGSRFCLGGDLRVGWSLLVHSWELTLYRFGVGRQLWFVPAFYQTLGGGVIMKLGLICSPWSAAPIFSTVDDVPGDGGLDWGRGAETAGVTSRESEWVESAFLGGSCCGVVSLECREEVDVCFEVLTELDKTPRMCVRGCDLLRPGYYVFWCASGFG
ncbi:hypothetical protein Dimus_013363, partial [Dionaea muscipula]